MARSVCLSVCLSGFENIVDTISNTFQLCQVDALVNNAGIYDSKVSLGPYHVSTDFKVVETNLLGAILGTTLALEKMSVERGGGGGIVVQISSTAALMTTGASSFYTASKGGNSFNLPRKNGNYFESGLDTPPQHLGINPDFSEENIKNPSLSTKYVTSQLLCTSLLCN